MRVGQGYFAGRMTVLNTLLTLPVCLPTFTTVVQSAYDSVPLIEQDELVILYRSVALRAITNAGGSQELCYQGTRTTIIGDIENFIRGQGGHQCQMMWLSGPVGAGKTTIVQTIAERCDKANIQVATFYFSREDAIRNHAGNLVATLLYQLFVFFPILKQFVRDCLSSNPLILGAPIQDQFMQLISLPLRDIRHPAIVLLVDGLDECDDKTEQQQVLMALHALSMQEHSPFIVLVSSRDEYHLRLSFGKLGPTVTSTILDHDRYRPHDDIYRFVVGKFEEMKKLRPFISHNDWPSVTAIKAITAKSSGQFLYAATVMQYIENSPASPTLSLAWIQGAQLVESHSPLAGLDSKYAFVFSRATNVDFTNHILAAHFLSHRSRQGSQHRLYFVDTLKLYNSRYTCDTIESYISDLTSIIKPVRRPEPGEPLLLSFYHESLGDYLLDESRSGIYYVDVDGFAAELVSGLLQKFHDQCMASSCRCLLH